MTVTTEPPKLAVEVTYDGLSSFPVSVGHYQVVATVTDGYYYGSATNTLEITVGGQTISFPPLAAHTYGDGLFRLDATASSGLLVSFRGVGRNNHTRAHGSIRTSHLGKVGDRCNRSSNFALAALHKRTPLA